MCGWVGGFMMCVYYVVYYVCYGDTLWFYVLGLILGYIYIVRKLWYLGSNMAET